MVAATQNLRPKTAIRDGKRTIGAMINNIADYTLGPNTSGDLVFNATLAC